MPKSRRVPWILSYRQKKLVSGKFRKTEEEARQAKLDGNWNQFSRLKYLLRKCWWGIKSYKDK